MDHKQRLGRAGEDLARIFLEACGYRILDRRWRLPGGEIDLVAARGRAVVFVEVKCRAAGAPVPAVAAVSPRQRRCLRRAAVAWLAAHPGGGTRDCRFDVVAVDFGGDGRGCLVRHFAGAF